MSSEIPSTPRFSAELERRLVSAATHGHHKRLPARTGALRSLRELSRSALHAALACGLAATLLLVAPTALDQAPPPLGPDLTASLTPGYLQQYGARDVETTITAAREHGYEVQLVTWYVPGQTGGEEIVSIRHAGEEVDGVPHDDGARGPLLIVVGLSIGNHYSAAN